MAFDLGHIVITSGAGGVLDPLQVLTLLQRHIRGDWGDLCEEDRQLNDTALKNNDGRLLSSYDADGDRPKVWIITEWDRSVTTILLPEEY